MNVRLALLLPLAALLATGCDQLAATVSAASVLTGTPDLANAQNLQASGLAGVLPLGSLEVKPGTAVLVAVGERESPTSTATPAPLGGAQVALAWDGGRVIACEVLAAGAEGTYQTSSIAPAGECGNPLLAYEEQADYLTEIETGTDFFTLSVKAPPPVAPANVVFTPQLAVPSSLYGATLPSHQTNTVLTVDWSQDTAAADKHAFITVARIRYVGGTGATDALAPASWQADPQPVFDNLPRDAGGLIALVAGDPEPTATIPAEVFDQPGVYILVVTTTEVSTDVSTNLFLGSNAMAGIGTAFVFRVN